MARTKTAARKNASQISQTPSPPSSPHPSPNNQPRPSKSPEKASETSQSPKSKLDQPSQNLSDHMQNEPDHVSDSLSEQSENVPTDEDLHQTQTETQNDDGLITPDPSIIVPSQAETPPVYVKPKKTKTSSISKLSKSPLKSKSKTPSRSKSISKLSFKSPSKSSSKSKSKAKSTNSSRIRRSARIQSGVGTGRKIIKNTTVHVIDDDDDVDDSEKTLSAQPRPSKSPEKASETSQSPKSKLDQPSQNLSDHMQNEPDHVSDSLSEQSENVPTDEDLHQTQTETQNDDGLITPDPSIIVPSQAETPPVYVKPKKTKTSSISKLSKSPLKSKSKTPSRSKSISKLSFKSPSKSSSKSKSKAKSTNSSRIRRSARIQSGVGTGRKIIKNTTVHVIDDDDDVDDSEKTLSAQPADELLDDVEAVTSTKSAPTKPKSKPSPVSTKKSPTPKVSKGKEKMVFKEKGKAASDGKEQKKKAKTKFIPIPLIHPDDKENFEKYWKVKPVPAGRIFYFVELEKKGINVLKYVEPLGWTNFFKIKDSVLPQLVQAFYHNANVHEDKNLIISNIRGVEIQIDTETLGCLINLPFEGATIYGGDWYSKLGVSKEALILELFNEEGAKMEEPTSSYLKKEFKIIHNMLLHCIFPRIGSKQKVTDIDLLIMYHMTKGIKLNLPYVIIQHMIHAAKSGSKKIALPYGMILTKIFRIFEIDESNQRVDNS
ncbi:Delta-1-pyrroline-5-carboxylate synthase [Trifolium repens]|nr:Delta-1-pyrroline-5-carboxylate synthase [Trifolium repens]